MNSANEVIEHICLNAISEFRASSNITHNFRFTIFEQREDYCNILPNFSEVWKK
jgi:hypothetical protein